MNIQLDENYSIESDTACWVLNYEKEGEINPKTGKPIISPDASYHANLRQALAKYLDNALKPCKDAQDLMRRITEVEKTIEKVRVSV